VSLSPLTTPSLVPACLKTAPEPELQKAEQGEALPPAVPWPPGGREVHLMDGVSGWAGPGLGDELLPDSAALTCCSLVHVLSSSPSSTVAKHKTRHIS
jgi:hypothetical protein